MSKITKTLKKTIMLNADACDIFYKNLILPTAFACEYYRKPIKRA